MGLPKPLLLSHVNSVNKKGWELLVLSKSKVLLCRGGCVVTAHPVGILIKKIAPEEHVPAG